MKFSRIPLDTRIALFFAIFGGLWILLSDRLLALFVTDISTFTRIATYKGWAFVAASAVLIYYVVHRNLAMHARTENDLAKSERRFSTVFRTSPMAIAISRLTDNHFIEVNEAFERLTGYSREEIINHTAVDVNLWVYHEERERLIQELQANERVRDFEFQLRCKSGNIVDMLISAELIDLDGEPHMLNIAQNITERKRSEQELRTAEEKYHTIFDSAVEGIFQSTPEGRFITVNPALARMWGYDCPEQLISDITDITHQLYVEPQRRVEFMRLMQQEGAVHDFEFQISLRDGRLVWVLENARAVRDAEGKIQYYEGHIQDVTQRKQVEVALRESEARFASAFEYAAIGMALVAPDGRWLKANRKLCEILGYSADEMLERTFQDVTHPDDLEADLGYVRQMLQGEIQTYQMEKRYLHKCGNTVWVLLSVSLVRNNQNEPLYFISQIQDITDKKQAEMERERLLDTLEASLNEIFIFDIDTWKYEYVNAGARRNLGYSLEQLKTMTPLDLKPAFDTASFEQLVAPLLKGEQEVAVFETEHRRADGSLYSVEIHMQVVAHSAGNIFLAIANDITERKQAEQSLLESERRYRTLAEAAQDMIFIINDVAKVDYVNEYGARQFRCEPQDLIGKSLDEIFPPQVAARQWQNVSQVMTSGESGYFENRFPFTANELWLGTSLVPIRDGGEKVQAVLGFARDITARKQAEAALRAGQEKYRYLFENNPHCMWLYDMKTLQFLAVNDAAVKKYGYTREEFLNMSIVDIRPAEEKERLNGYLVQAREPLVRSEGWKHQLKDGTLIDVAITSHTIHFDGHEAVLVVAQDITDKKRAEEKAQQQLKRISALRDIDRVITSSLDLRLTLNRLLTQVTEQLQAEAAAILLFDPNTFTLEYFALRGFSDRHTPDVRLPLGGEGAGKVALERRLIHLSLRDLAKSSPADSPLLGQGFAEYYGLPLISKGQLRGVLEVYHRSQLNPDADWLDYLDTLAGQAAIAIDNIQMFDGLQRSNLELTRAYDATIEGWSRALDLRDQETEGHTQRVTELTLELARVIGFNEKELVNVRWGALLHDIGKMGIPDLILLKPGPLTDDEWEQMRQHPVLAFEMLSRIRYLHDALDIPHYHHEKWDGTGYPSGLHGEQIPLAARIFAIVDIWDALHSNRPYRRAWEESEIIKYIKGLSGTHLDPEIVKTFFDSKIYQRKKYTK